MARRAGGRLRVHHRPTPNGRAGAREIAGFSVVLHGVKPADSLRLQFEGMGGERGLGWGIFVPHKSIAAVRLTPREGGRQRGQVKGGQAWGTWSTGSSSRRMPTAICSSPICGDEVVAVIAAAEGIELSDAHWEVVRYPARRIPGERAYAEFPEYAEGVPGDPPGSGQQVSLRPVSDRTGEAGREGRRAAAAVRQRRILTRGRRRKAADVRNRP